MYKKWSKKFNNWYKSEGGVSHNHSDHESHENEKEMKKTATKSKFKGFSSEMFAQQQQEQQEEQHRKHKATKLSERTDRVTLAQENIDSSSKASETAAAATKSSTKSSISKNSDENISGPRTAASMELGQEATRHSQHPYNNQTDRQSSAGLLASDISDTGSEGASRFGDGGGDDRSDIMKPVIKKPVTGAHLTKAWSDDRSLPEAVDFRELIIEDSDIIDTETSELMMESTLIRMMTMLDTQILALEKSSFASIMKIKKANENQTAPQTLQEDTDTLQIQAEPVEQVPPQDTISQTISPTEDPNTGREHDDETSCGDQHEGQNDDMYFNTSKILEHVAGSQNITFEEASDSLIDMYAGKSVPIPLSFYLPESAELISEDMNVKNIDKDQAQETEHTDGIHDEKTDSRQFNNDKTTSDASEQNVAPNVQKQTQNRKSEDENDVKQDAKDNQSFDIVTFQLLTEKTLEQLWSDFLPLLGDHDGMLQRLENTNAAYEQEVNELKTMDEQDRKRLEAELNQTIEMRTEAKREVELYTLELSKLDDYLHDKDIQDYKCLKEYEGREELAKKKYPIVEKQYRHAMSELQSLEKKLAEEERKARRLEDRYRDMDGDWM